MSSDSRIADKRHTAISVSITSQYCLRKRLGSFECNVCTDNCIHQALHINNGEIVIEKERCSGCGKCVAVCPADVFSITELDYRDFIIQINKADAPVISCFKQKRRSGAYLLPCLGTVPIEALLAIGVSATGRVYLQTAECASCDNFSLIERLNHNLCRLAQLLGESLKAEFKVITTIADLPGTSLANRRSFLIELCNRLKTTSRNALGLWAPPGSRKHATTLRRKIPQKTRLLNEALGSPESTQYRKLSALCFPTIRVNENCTLCPLCTGMCPTGAIRVEKNTGRKSLHFTATRCTDCGLCEEFCKENALHINQSPLRKIDKGP